MRLLGLPLGIVLKGRVENEAHVGALVEELLRVLPGSLGVELAVLFPKEDVPNEIARGRVYLN